MLALSRLPATRIVSTPAALDSAAWPKEALVFRIASDEALIMPPQPDLKLDDPHAIVVAEGGFAGAWMPAAEALALMERHCDWEPPEARPAFAQGAVAGLPAKFWFEADRVLVMVPAPLAAEFEERAA